MVFSLKERSSLDLPSAIISAASVFSHCDQHKRDMIFFFDKGSTLVIICCVKNEIPTSLSEIFSTSQRSMPYSISLRASFRSFQSGGRKFGSKVMMHPASFATSRA